MFAPTGLFRGVKCPGGTRCDLVECIFSHDFPRETQTEIDPSAKDSNTNAGDGTKTPGEPPLKRRRINENSVQSPRGEISGASRVTPTISPHPKLAFSHSGPSSIAQASTSSAGSKLRNGHASVSRTVSPPKSVAKAKSMASETQTELSRSSPRKESLAPRLLKSSPAPFPQRLTFLKLIHEQISRLNKLVQQDDGEKQTFALSEAEVVSMALDEEEKIGKENAPIYKSIIGNRIVRLKKIKLQDWKDSLVDYFKKKYKTIEKPAPPAPKKLETGLNARQEIAVLAHILTPIEGLDEYGYVTAPPTSEAVQKAAEGVEAGAGFERCERCGSRFRVFLGRDSDETSSTFGRLTSTEHGCTYHWARAVRPPKTSKVATQGENYHPCCHGAVGSRGCTEAADHVFKTTGINRLASVLQFEKTPQPTDPDVRHLPVTFDCEMGYTTNGMELIRLTACSWPGNKILLDVLVRPLGEVVDFNTRFSGVSAEQFGKAPLWATQADSSSSSESGEVGPKPLQLVESPMVARQLLFDLLTPETPLIGHAIDNDLNTCRIIHPTIVDTVLLFPHPRGLPMRYGLKMLTSKYLDRSIQTAGAGGHDSMEDANATGDLVRYKVGEKWKRMKLEGWTFEDAVLVPPETVASSAVKGGKGKKRLASEVDGAESEVLTKASG